MCGIAGRFSWGRPPDGATIGRMTRRMRHRGPDAEGLFLEGDIGLGHRRLAIIDLREAGNQPMVDHSGRYWIVFNGEIYNFAPIRRTLEDLGHRFLTRTDTEVILESYKRWGTACLERFNGMFAFALWDREARSLFLARDRLGKKPLFYYPLPDGGVVFASELKALIEDPEVPRQVDPVALSHYLSLNYTLTGAAILAGVKKLPPAHCLVWRREGGPVLDRYWDLAEHFRRKNRFASEREAVEAFNALLEDSVRLRLVSDVPLGGFLSGGIDSSTIIAAMSRLGKPSEVRTFSIGFPERTYCELHEAQSVAAHLGVTFNSRLIDAEFAVNLPALAYQMDEPFADTSIFPMVRLSAFAREQVTVALSGDGADELFAGYTTYTADWIHQRTRRLPGWLIGLLERAVNRLVPVTYDKIGFDYKIRQFLAGHRHSPQRAHYSWRCIFSEPEKQALVRPPWREAVAAADPFIHFERHFREVADCHYLDQAMYVDIKTWLADDILVKVDRTTMAHSLEARAPFLDYRLVEFAAALPVALKMKGLKRKYLLKASQKGCLPERILNRPKEGFNAPIAHWLAETRDRLFADPTRAALAGEFFVPEEVDRLWREHLAMERDNGLRLLGLVMFHMWQAGLGAAEPPVVPH
ncbi:MAG: asparagine synthase (glutamine-hydrolyzing) [Magnetococcales bacterium]|nr:asparagine synthase (glutamine-hydrolyzing) [Magnetococcales bacterium]